MVDYDPIVVAALKTVLPTYHELTIHSGLKTPCISYQEANNYVTANGTTIGHSKVSYTVKIWGNDISELKRYILMIDDVLRPLGFKRISTGELGDRTSTMIQKILTYEANASEQF